LAEFEVAEPDALHGGKDAADTGEVGEEVGGFGYGHVEHIGYGFAAVFDEQGFTVVSFTFAVFALDINIGGKFISILRVPAPLAGFASASFDIEAEPAGFVASDLGFGQAAEEVADEGEDSGIGCGVGTGCAAYGGLVYADNFVYVFKPFNGGVRVGEEF